MEPKLTTPSFSTDSNDGNSCTDDVCNQGACQNSAPRADCCGNGICESVESNSCSNDCGPFTLATLPCIGTCITPNEVKFNVNATNDIMMQNLTIYVRPTSNTMTVTVYSATGGYESTGDDAWVQVANATFPRKKVVE